MGGDLIHGQAYGKFYLMLLAVEMSQASPPYQFAVLIEFIDWCV